MKKSKILLLLLIFILALSAFACSSGVNVDDFSVASKSDSVESSQGGEGGTGSIVTPSKDKTYAITVGTFEHGSVTVEGGVKSAKKGEQVVFIVTADSGYELAWIKVNDGNDLKSQIVSGKLTVTMYEMDVKVTALFSETGKINNSSYGPVKDDNAKENDLFSAIRETTQNGQFTLSAYNEIRYGDTVNITATPSDGYKVKEVVVTTRENNATTVKVHGNHNDWAFVMPKANVSVKVTFEKELYEITVAEVDGVQITLSKTSAYYGDEISVTDVSVDEGYTLLRIEANGVVVTDDKFTMPAGNVTLKAFVEKRKYTITVGTHAYGQVTIEGGLEHEFGETVVISLTPDDNYQLNRIEVVTDGAQTVPLNDLTFVMPSENVHIVISFKEATAKYGITVNTAENGKITSDKTQAVFGEKVTLTATPDDKYELAQIEVKAGATDVVVTNNSFAMPESNVEVTATFVKKSYAVTIVSANGSTDLNEKYKWSEKVTFNVTPDSGYEVASVTLKVDGQTAQTLTRLSTGYEFDMPEANVTITVSYTVKKYALIISETTNGSVKVSNTGSKFAEGELISVLVEPSEGYYLKSLKYNDVDILSEKQFTMPAGIVTITAEFEKKSYGLTIDVTSGEGSGTVTATTYNPLYQDSVTLTITPANGFALTRIYVKGVDVTSQIVKGKYTFDMPASDVVVTAVFETSAFAITLTQPENGGTISSTLTEARYNAEVVLTAELEKGYSLTKFIVKRVIDDTEVELTKVTDNEYKFLMPNGEVTVTAVIEKTPFNITLSVGEGGTVTIVDDKKTATYGEDVALTITPESGYRLKNVTGVTLGEGNKFTMPAENVTITVEFEKIPYNINTVVTGGVGGTIDVKSTAVDGEQVTVTVTPATGYKLKDLTGVTIGEDNKFTMPAENVTITVEFEKINYTVTVDETTNGTASVGDKTTATYGETVTITVSPAEEHVLGGISINDGAVDCKKVSDTTYEFSMPAQSVTIVVTFSQEPHTITLSVGEGGTVTVVDDKKTATYGEEVALIITPETGYKLKSVTGVTLDDNNKFSMPASDVTVTVEFEKIQYALSISVSGGNGTASIENDKATATYGETVTVIATANGGYVLDTITVNGSAISGTSFSMPAGSVEIVVTFKNASVTVSTGTCTNGSVSATPSGTVEYGATITLTATPNTGYELDYFTANGEKIVGGGSTYTVTSNVEFKAVFKAKSYTLTVQHKCGSTVLQTETLAMTFGTSTTVNAKTIEGYTATSSSISVTMDTEGKTVTISYNKNNYTLTVQHIIQGDGSAFASTETYTVAYGESKTVNPVSLTAYNGLIKASEGSKTVTMGASSQTVTYAYSLDTTKKFSSGSSTGAIPVITAKTGFSVTYKITDDTAYSIGDWCKVFSIKNANVFTGCVNWFDDNGTFVDDWFDGVHGHGNNDAYGTTYNYDAVIKEGCVYTISFNTDGSIDWYRNGLRVLYFDATTKNNTKTISDYVSFMISGANSSGIKIENGAQTNDSGTILNKTNVSDCYIGYAIDKKTVTVSYSFSDTSDVSRGNSVYYMAPGFEYTFNTAMSGYSASRSTVVTGTGTSAESYSVTYTRSATTSTSVLSTPVLVARKGITGVSGFVKVNGISGDFFMQAKLTDVYQMQTATDSWRAILVGIYNTSNNSLGRYLRFDKFSWSIGSPYGEWTQGYNGMSSVLQSVMQGRSDILITITKTGTTVVVGYKVYSYAKSATYYMDFLIESVSGTVDVGFGGEDSTYTLEYINMENATGSVAVDTSTIGTTVYNKDWASGSWTDGRVRTTIRTGLTGNFNATINLYQLTYSSGYTYTDANWRTAILAIYGWCDYSHVTVLRQDGHWWCDGGGDTGNSTTVTSSDTSLFTGNGTNTTGTKFADITRNAYIQITVAGTNVGTSSGKIVVTYYINSLNPDYKNTQYWLKYEISGVTRSHYDGYNTASVDLVMLCELASYVVYSYSVS